MNKIYHGFTLIEAIVVIVVVSILSVMIVIRYSSNRISTDTQVEQLVGELRYTQSLAMTHGRAFMINFNTATGTYAISDGANAVFSPATGQSPVTLSEGATFGTLTNLPNNLIAFNSHGIPYINFAITTPLANTAIIPIISPSGATINISITPETGRILVQ